MLCCCFSSADDAQRDLDAALPALDAAVASLKNLQRNDVVEVKSLQNPPAGVKLVMEVTCIMFDEKPKMKDDPNKMGAFYMAFLQPHSTDSCWKGPCSVRPHAVNFGLRLIKMIHCEHKYPFSLLPCDLICRYNFAKASSYAW